MNRIVHAGWNDGIRGRWAAQGWTRGVAIVVSWIVFQREGSLDRHLPVCHVTAFNLPSRLDHLEPAKVSQTLRRLGYRVSDGVFRPGGGRPNQFDCLVDVIHAEPPAQARANPIHISVQDLRLTLLGVRRVNHDRCGA